MSNIIILDLPILKLIYNNLELQDKFAFSFINKRFHLIFNNCCLLDTTFQIDHECGYRRGNFLYKNVVKIDVVSSNVNINYLTMFKKLRDLNLSQMEFSDNKRMKALIFRLPKSLLNITVKNEGMKEMFEQGAFDNERTFSVKISTPKKLWSDESEEGGTPPFISEWYEKQLEALTVYKNRSKYALNYTQEFIPNEILQNFPRLRTTQYRTVIYETPFGKDTTNNTDILTDVERLKDLLMHSIIQSQQYNWILITEVRVVYRKNKEINVDPSNKYPNTLVVSKENICSSERAWYELRFEYKKFEVIATGGYYNQDDSNDFGTFVGTAAPDHMARDTQFILLSPVIPAKTTSKPKNFKKVNKSNKWRFKSVLFSEK